MQPQLKRYIQGDEDKIALLFRESDWTITRKEAYWNWIYNENPLGEPIAHVYIDQLSSMFAGHYGLLPMEFKINGSTVKGSNSIHTLTGRNFRRKGIMSTLGKHTYKKAAENGIDITITFPNRNSYPFYKQKLPGYQELGPLLTLARPLNFTGICRRYRIPKILAPPSEGLFNRIFKPLGHVEIEKVDAFGPEIDEFWGRVSKHYKNIQVRKMENLNWRFAGQVKKYDIFIAKENGAITGYIATSHFQENGLTWGLICDYLAKPDDTKTIDSLVSKATEHLSQIGCDFVTTMLTRPNPFFSHFKKFGFFMIPTTLWPKLYFPFFVRNNTGKLNYTDIHKIEDWYINTSDTEFLVLE